MHSYKKSSSVDLYIATVGVIISSDTRCKIVQAYKDNDLKSLDKMYILQRRTKKKRRATTTTRLEKLVFTLNYQFKYQAIYIKKNHCIQCFAAV